MKYLKFTVMTTGDIQSEQVIHKRNCQQVIIRHLRLVFRDILEPNHSYLKRLSRHVTEALGDAFIRRVMVFWGFYTLNEENTKDTVRTPLFIFGIYS